MSEPISVKDALRAVEMAQEVCKAATEAPWRNVGYGVVRGGPFQEYTNGMADDQICSVMIPNRDHAPAIRDANTAFIVSARAGFAGTLEYLRRELLPRSGSHYMLIVTGMDSVSADEKNGLYEAVAPILAWAKAQPGWEAK